MVGSSPRRLHGFLPSVSTFVKPVRRAITKSATDACPSYEVRIEDPELSWKTVAKELCEDEGILVEIKPVAFLASPGFKVVTETAGMGGQFRLRGTHHYGCEGKTGPSQCEAGPYERYTPATYTVK